MTEDVNMMRELTLEDFIAMSKKPRKVLRISVPEMGGETHVRRLTCREMDRLEIANMRDDDNDSIRARSLAIYICNADGIQMFCADIPEHLEFLRNLPRPIADYVLRKAMQVNTSTADDAVEKAVKN